jgi:hypothetical protein
MMRISAAFVAILFGVSLRAQAPTSFSKGVMAFEKKEWKDAEKFMRETIAGNPNESAGTVSVAGSWFETYVPHYFLARALAKQGKCAEALKEFEETERQGVSPTIPDFVPHLQTRGGCKPQAKPAKPKEIVFETTVPFGEEGTTPVTTSSAPVIPRPVTPRNDTKPAPPVTKVVPTRDPARESATRARLAVAVTAYLHGRYDEAARLLTETKFDDRAAVAEAALFRAAARYALYRIGGEKDAGLRAQLDADLKQYRTLTPSARPDARMFPPSFVALTQTH